MTPQEKAYLLRLRALCETIDDKYDYEVFYAVCKRFMQYKRGEAESKNITKTELIDLLISKGFMSMVYNKETGAYDKRPDDRGLRRSIRELLKKGYPVITTSHNDGCFIAENEEEVAAPQKENHSRAVAILAVDKGYNLVKAFIKGGEAQ